MQHFKTYSGKEPYVFFSYAHANSDKVLPVIEILDQKNYRLWYDAGIEAGSNWPEVVASHLLNSDTVLLFVSDRFLKSQNCAREVNYAVSERKKMYCIFLEDVKLPEDMAMQLSTVEKLYAFDMNERQIAEKIIEKIGEEYLGDGVTGYEKAEKKGTSANIWRIISIVFASLFLLLAGSVFAYFNNWFSFAGVNNETIDHEGSEVEVTEFKDSLSQSILLKAYDGTSLYLCGNYMVSDADAIRYKDGNCYIGEQLIEEGTFDDLETIASKDISYLAMVNEGIEDFNELGKMSQLKYLDLSENPIKDLSFLKGLKQLQILKIIGVDADYDVIDELKDLKYLYISEDMYQRICESIDTSRIDVVVKR
ncbi:MAG: TIR domain-containing protein [Erysipelotrichaceae bacterium]|nr:TIR domain-containing protein [Erysipelotrichaceae bacterium]